MYLLGRKDWIGVLENRECSSLNNVRERRLGRIARLDRRVSRFRNTIGKIFKFIR